MKDYDKNKELSYLKYLNINSLNGWAMSQKLIVNDSKWVGDISKFDKSFTKVYNEVSDEKYFLDVDVQYLKNLHNHKNDSPFLSERIKNLKSN